MFKKKNYFFYLGILSLFIGFLFNENASGGGKIDVIFLSKYIKNFSENLSLGLKTFDVDHSPVFYIFQAFIYNIFKNDYFFKIFYIFLSSLIPLIFYQSLKYKYKFNNDYLFLFSLIIFFSPYFRSSAIWTLGDNLAILFFSIFCYFYIRSEKKFTFDAFNFLSLFFLVLASYIRPIYSFFWIFLSIQKLKNFNIKNIFIYFLTSFILSIAALIYLFINLSTNINLKNKFITFTNFNYVEITIVFLSIISFYLFPFVVHDYKNIFNFVRSKGKIIYFCSFAITSIFLFDHYYFFDLINISNFGGGVFYKLSSFIEFDFNFILLLTSIIGLILFFFISQGKYFLYNLSILTFFILYSPSKYIFQKYIDPLYLFLFFVLLKSETIYHYFKFKKFNLSFVYFYFFVFLSFSIYYYY